MVKPRAVAADLGFSLFGIPVQVSIWFWLVGVALGYSTLRLGVAFLLTWLAVLFVSILVHELGHAFVARSFGYRPRILLYQLGGLAFYEAGPDHSARRSIAISLAGPAAGFALLALVWLGRETLLPHATASFLRPRSDLVWFAVAQLIWINLWWGLLNLLPTWPLDGGRICRDLCLAVSPERGAVFTHAIGAAAGGAVAAWLLVKGYPFAALFFALLAAYNLSALRPAADDPEVA